MAGTGITGLYEGYMGEVIRSIALSLRGNIGIDFYIYNYPGHTTPTESTVVTNSSVVIAGTTYKLKELTTIDAAKGYQGRRDWYIPYETPIRTLGDTFVVSWRGIVSGGEVKDCTLNYSVRQYLQDVAASEAPEQYKNLCSSLDTFSKYAQVYFNYNADDVSSDLPALQDVPDYMKYAPSEKGNLPTGVSYVGVSLLYNAQLVLRFYFKTPEGKSLSDYTHKINGTTQSVKVANAETRLYYMELTLPYYDADKYYDVSVGDYTLHYCALSYLESAYNNSSNTNLFNLSRSFYWFYDALSKYYK